MTIIKQLNEALERKYFLTEAKQDEEKFIAFAGEDLAARFKKLKDANRIQNDKENKKNYADYEYWEKLPVEELEGFVTNLESTPTRKMMKKGAEEVYHGNGWTIYKILTYDASKFYGRNTKWCIAGNYDGEEVRGQQYFNNYKHDGVEDYYFLIPDNDPYGKWCYLKYADSNSQYDKQNNVFFRSDDLGFPFVDAATIARTIPPEVLEHLPYFEDYKAYQDKGNIEVTYTNGQWKIYKALNDSAVRHYFGYFMGQRGMKKPETYYFIMKGTTPICCYYCFPTLREAEENNIFLEVRKFFGTTAASLPDMAQRIPMDVLLHLPYIDKIVGDAERFDNSVRNGTLVYTDDLTHAPILLMKNKITKVIIPNTTKYIADGVFANVASLLNIEFEAGSTLEEIADDAFEYTSIHELIIPRSVKRIGRRAFYSCLWLGRIRVEGGAQLEEIGEDAFYHTEDLKVLNLPASVKKIGKHAFGGCPRLTYVRFPADSQLTEIDEFAFNSCDELKTLSLPSSLQVLENAALNDCPNLEEINIPEDSQLRWIDTNVFSEDTKLRRLELPASLTHIGRHAFGGTPVMRITIHGEYRPRMLDQDCGLNLASEINWVDANKKTTWGELKY